MPFKYKLMVAMWILFEFVFIQKLDGKTRHCWMNGKGIETD